MKTSNKMPWLRLYTDFLNDSKIIALSFDDQRHYVCVLLLKSDGVIDQDCDEVILDKIVARGLWLDGNSVREVKRRLIEAGLIDDRWQPLAWSKRQFRSDFDPSGAERQRRYRESQKAKSRTDSPVINDENNSNALRNAHSDATVTLPDTETETETDTYITLSQDRESVEQNSDESLNAPSLAHDEPKKNRANAKPSTSSGSRLPADWTLSADWLKWAISETGWSDGQIKRMADSFRDYWLSVAGAKGRKADWEATWRNWVRREQSHAQITPQSHAQKKKFNPGEYALYGDLSPSSGGRC